MRSKRTYIIALIVLLSIGTLFAATPSVFEVGLLNYYTIQDLSDSEFANYTPAIRLSTFVTKWFGLSMDVVMDAPFASDGTYDFLLTTDAIFRAPLGFVDAYVALGPVYAFEYEQELKMKKEISYNAKLGFDFNLNPLFSIGAEGVYLFKELDKLISGESSFEPMEEIKVGINFKLKL
jgi:hypothetical protein